MVVHIFYAQPFFYFILITKKVFYASTYELVTLDTEYTPEVGESANVNL